MWVTATTTPEPGDGITGKPGDPIPAVPDDLSLKGAMHHDGA